MYVLVWCIICSGLGVLNWSGVMYVQDWCFDWYIVCTVVCTGLVCCMRGEGRGEALPLHLYERGRVVVGSTRHLYTSSQF